MDRRTVALAPLVLAACGAVVTPADDTGTGGTDTTGASPSDPSISTSVGSQVDGHPASDDGPLDDGPLDEGSSTDTPPACEDPPAPELTCTRSATLVRACPMSSSST